MTDTKPAAAPAQGFEKYPQMLYKRGGDTTVFDKVEVTTKTVENDDELQKALDEGFVEDVTTLQPIRYEKGGTPATKEGGEPVDGQHDKGLEGQKGKAERFFPKDHGQDSAAYQAGQEALKNPPKPPADAGGDKSKSVDHDHETVRAAGIGSGEPRPLPTNKDDDDDNGRRGPGRPRKS